MLLDVYRASSMSPVIKNACGTVAARIAWSGGSYKLARSALREHGRSNAGIPSLPHVKLSPMSATGERQEHLDAIVSFSGAGQRRRLFRGLDILTIKWATGDLPEECRFLLNTQMMLLKTRPRSSSMTTNGSARWRKRRKSRPTSQGIASCVVSKTLPPEKGRPSQMGEFLRKYVSRRLLALN